MSFQLLLTSPVMIRAVLGGLVVMASAAVTQAATVRVTVDNLGVTGGTSVTPVFTGFHNGSFDLFSQGAAATPQLEALAEDGNNAPAGSQFAAAGFVGNNVFGPGTPPVIRPTESGTQTFDIQLDGNASRLLLATMVLPTNDWFLGNDDPNGLDLSTLANGPISFMLNRLYDAGTEVDDFNTSAANGLLAGLPVGQTANNVGDAQNGLVTFLGTIQSDGSLLDAMGNVVADPFANFLNRPAGFNPTLSPLRVTITAVPEPSLSIAAGVALMGAVVRRRRRRATRVA